MRRMQVILLEQSEWLDVVVVVVVVVVFHESKRVEIMKK